MQLPRQADGSSRPGTPSRCAPSPRGGDVAELLRGRRQGLVQEVRTLEYRQRLVQARTDLVVAGLLYGAPVPACDGRPVGPAEPAGPDPDLDLDPADLLLGPAGTAGPGGGEGPGATLDRLRRAALALAARRRGLQDELDTVTAALHDALASDGAATGTALVAG